MKGFITNPVRLGNRQINGMNAFWHSPPTVLGHLACVKKTQEKPKTKWPCLDSEIKSRNQHTLKASDRHLTNTDTNEDFRTCPSEVARIFFDSPYFSGKKIVL